METVQAQPRQSRFDRFQRGWRHGRGVDAENQLHLRLAEQGTAHRAQLFQQRIVNEMGLDQNGDHGIEVGSGNRSLLLDAQTGIGMRQKGRPA